MLQTSNTRECISYGIIIYMMLMLFYLIPNQVSAQVQAQPLSRNDKAQVDKWMEGYEKAKSDGFLNQASEHLNQIAFLHWEHNDYQKAIDFYEISLEINHQVNNENGLAMLHNNLGMLYADIENYEKSLEYLNLTLAARRAQNSKEGMIAALKNMSVSLNNLGRYDESLSGMEEALIKARELANPDEIASCYLILSETYQKKGDVTKSMEYFDLYQSLYDYKSEKDKKALKQLADEEALKKELAELEARKSKIELQGLQNQLDAASQELDQFDVEQRRLIEDLDKTQLQIKTLEAQKEVDRLQAEREISQQKALRNLMLVAALAFLAVSFFVYRNYKQEQRSKRVLANKNEKINQQNDELESLNAIIAKHNERMQSELNVGREIQMSMIPSHFPEVEGVDLFAALVPAREVGGDLYDFFTLDDDHLLFGIGDVSDKGVPAALFMAVTKTLVKTNAAYSSLPGKILTEVNKELCEDNESSMFVTYFLCVLNTKTGTLTYSNAGHNPPLFISNNGKLRNLDTIHGPVLGAVEDFEYKQDQLTMDQGEQLVLFTDGVTEAMNIENLQYTAERLDDLFSHNGKHNSQESVEAIIEDVGKFRGEAEQSDDITIMSLIYTGV